MSDRETVKFKQALESLNLRQHVLFPTHNKGHILDLILTRCDDLSLTNISIQPPAISDHSAISFDIPIGKPPSERKLISYRKVKNININEFKDDILNSSLYSSPCDDINKLVEQYNNVLSDIIDKHAPLITKTITQHENSPWFHDEIRDAKQERRKAERLLRSSKLQVHHDMFKIAHKKVTKLCSDAKANYFCDKIHENSGNQKELFKITNDLLHRKKSMPLPTHNNAEDLAN